MANFVEWDTYVEVDNKFDREIYNQDLNQNISQNLSSEGWKLPHLTTTEVNSLLASGIRVGTQWYNTTDNVMQFMTNSGVVSIDTTPWP